MKEPKVGEIWQCTQNHKDNHDIYEHVLSVKDGIVTTSLVASQACADRVAAEAPIGDEEWDMGYFMKSHMYVW